jgi:hypothetical protein
MRPSSRPNGKNRELTRSRVGTTITTQLLLGGCCSESCPSSRERNKKKSLPRRRGRRKKLLLRLPQPGAYSYTYISIQVMPKRHSLLQQWGLLQGMQGHSDGRGLRHKKQSCDASKVDQVQNYHCTDASKQATTGTTREHHD